MKAARILLVAIAHIAFLFTAYGTGLFGLARWLPSWVVLALWLLASSALAAWGYYRAGHHAPVQPFSRRGAMISVAGSLASLYVGVASAIHAHGT